MNAFRERAREYDDRPKYNQFKSYNSTPDTPVKKDFEIKEDEFPDLAKPNKTNTIKSNLNNIESKSFASLLEKKEIIEETNKKEEKLIIPPGWSYYKYTKFNK